MSAESYINGRDGKSIVQRIEEVYDDVLSFKEQMQWALAAMRDAEERVKLENEEDYVTAKNGEIRNLLLLKWLRDDQSYMEARGDYQQARDDFRLAMLEVDRMRLLAGLSLIEGS